MARGLSDKEVAQHLQVDSDDYEALEAGLLRFKAIQLLSLSSLLRVSAAAFFAEFWKPTLVVSNGAKIRVPASE